MAERKRHYLLAVILIFIKTVEFFAASTTGKSAHTAASATGQFAYTAVSTTGQSANTAVSTTGQSANTAVSTTSLSANTAVSTTERVVCPKSRPFKCKNNKCIRISWLCDFIDDCGDRSDERICFDADFKCPEEVPFQCENRKCVLSSKTCDGRDDCGDNSDEKTCQDFKPIKCNNHVCREKEMICNGYDNCRDNSDEENCCAIECPEDRPYKCLNNKCIRRSFVCDKENNCGDMSDEINCPTLSCQVFEFRCSDGECVRAYAICNKKMECWDLSDEDGCEEPFPITTRGWDARQDDCPPFVYGLVGHKETSWQSDGTYTYCFWFVQAEFSHGIVVKVTDVSLKLGLNRDKDDVLRVYSGDNVWMYYADFIDDPVIITNSSITWFELISFRQNNRSTPGKIGVSMSYNTYPKHTLPPVLKAGVYNCSASYSMPPELQCDGFAQCLQAEDELDYNCNYTQLGCQEGWMAEGFLCLKFVFSPISISPRDSKLVCHDSHQAALGSLLHPSTQHLAAAVMARKGQNNLIVGLQRVQTSIPGLRHLYRFTWQWLQAGTEFDGPVPHSSTNNFSCAIFTVKQQFLPVPCTVNITSAFVCSKLNAKRAPRVERQHVQLDQKEFMLVGGDLRECDEGHSVHTFQPCSSSTASDTSVAKLPLMLCTNGQRVHYTMICDGYDDCGDQSDERSCDISLLPRPLTESSFKCTRQAQFVDNKLVCNGVPDCHDASDEDDCVVCHQGTVPCADLGCLPCDTNICSSSQSNFTDSVELANYTETLKIKFERTSRWEVNIDAYSVVTIEPVRGNQDCYGSHFQCGWAAKQICLPTFLIGNGQQDCPLAASQDEPSRGLTCPGHYRCYRHTICVHPRYFCDGVYHCPLKDDERYCDLPCPKYCFCEGLAYKCSKMFDPTAHMHVRYLDLSGADKPSLDTIEHMEHLGFLNISSCGLAFIDFYNFRIFDQLRVLDFSFNPATIIVMPPWFLPSVEVVKLSDCNLTKVSWDFTNSSRHLDVSGNRLTRFELSRTPFRVIDLSSNELTEVSLVSLHDLETLDLSLNNLKTVDIGRSNFTVLEFLNLSCCGLSNVSVRHMHHLRVLDLSSNNLKTMGHLTLKELHSLSHLDLSHNDLLTGLNGDLYTFLQVSGTGRLKSLFLRNTGIQSIDTDPFVDNDGPLHLDITGNDIGRVEKDMFTAWTSNLSLFESSSIDVCCAFYFAFPNTTVRCKTSTEVVFPVQCVSVGLGDRLGYRTAYSLSGQQATCKVGWLAFQSLCLRFVFPVHAISAREANRECQTTFSASLAALPAINELARSFVRLSGFHGLVIGLEKVSGVTWGQEHLYRFLWRWKRGSVEFRVPKLHADILADACAVFCVDCDDTLRLVLCTEENRYAFVCSQASFGRMPHSALSSVTLPRPSRTVVHFPSRVCSDGSFVHTFYTCPPAVAGSELDLGRSVFLRCKNGRHVHYTIICDGHDDCGDGGDEDNCQDLRSSFLKKTSFMCTGRKELVDLQHQCNGVPDCHDGSDEDGCDFCSEDMVRCLSLGCLPQKYTDSKWLFCGTGRQPPAGDAFLKSMLSSPTLSAVGNPSPGTSKNLTVVDLDAYGFPILSIATECPGTHFRCEGEFCIPGFLVKNGVHDCPLSPADDKEISSLSCPGYYHCYQSAICLHPHYLCDGTYHCPLKDDERYCKLSCPQNCTCDGLAYVCLSMFQTAEHLHVRFLDLSRTFRPPLDYLSYMGYLSYLNLSACSLDKVSLLDLVHLRVLDLSHNKLTNLTSVSLGDMPLLTILDMSNNPLNVLQLGEFLAHLASARMWQLLSLGVRATGVEHIQENVFQNMSSLRRIDLRDNDIRGINKGVFVGLTNLQVLETDDPRLCCPYSYVYPDRSMECRTLISELSSCGDLLRSTFFRACLWTLSVMIVVGNVGVVIYRLVLESQGTSLGFRVLVASLCVADFLMGVYMVIIGAADSHYSGQYIWQEEAWTDSALCQTAGFLALLSSEASAFMICLVTLDRLLVLCFPFSYHLHMTPRSSAISCGGAWVLGVFLAAIPLSFTEWRFYSQTGICLPLPITRRPFPGQQYAFAVFVVTNFSLFVLISAGQLAIFGAIHSTPMASRDSRRKQDMAIARRLFLIVFSDFSCWFPIGLMGLLANHGTPIPGEINIWAAIFILPVNSAINPFLYTLGMVLEKWLRKREERRIQRTLATLHADLVSWSDDELQKLMRQAERVLTSRLSLPFK